MFLFVCFIHCVYRADLLQLARIAVPSFFMISGCFCYSPIREGEEKEAYYERKLDGAKKKIISTLKYALFGLFFYFAFDLFYGLSKGQDITQIFAGFYTDHTFANIFVYNYVTSSGDHLWFLLALLAVSLVHYLIVRFKVEKAYFLLPLLILVLYFFAGLSYFYDGKFVDLSKIRNALFFGLPCFATGYDVHYIVHRLPRKSLLAKIAFPTSFFLLGGLFFYLQLKEWLWIGANAEMYGSSFLSSIFLLAFFLTCPSPNPRICELIFGKGFSFFAYVYHRAVLKVLCDYDLSSEKRVYLAFAFSLFFALVTHWVILSIKWLYRLVRKKKGNKPLDLSLS